MARVRAVPGAASASTPIRCDRRFHAQPNACPVCGPRSRSRCARAADRAATRSPPALACCAPARSSPIKGLGGFHLACDARNAGAVARLRERKQREEKPFAVMVANTARPAARWRRASAAERALLESPERPIVLLLYAGGCDEALAGVAPGLTRSA